ncbi:MAG TPA: DUF5985 family protein [Terriglobia bacterium]|nr:DUF5985 family protein [Terriglobia bacterium]
MAVVVYALCTMAAGLCAWLLLKAYSKTRYKLLLWAGLCFIGLTFNNALLVVDRMLIPQIDLFTYRLLLALSSMLLLLYGLIWEAE